MIVVVLHLRDKLVTEENFCLCQAEVFYVRRVALCGKRKHSGPGIKLDITEAQFFVVHVHVCVYTPYFSCL